MEFDNGGKRSRFDLRTQQISDVVESPPVPNGRRTGGRSGAPEPVCGTADNVLACGTAMVSSPDMGEPGPFEADLSYSVSAQDSARLAAYHTSPRDGGLLHFTTVQFRLLP